MANDVEWLECSEWFVQSHHIHWNVSDDLFMSQFFYAQIGRERMMWLSFLCYGANLDVILSFRVSHHVENWSFFVSLAGKVITSIHFNRTQKKMCMCGSVYTWARVFFLVFFLLFLVVFAMLIGFYCMYVSGFSQGMNHLIYFVHVNEQELIKIILSNLWRFI